MTTNPDNILTHDSWHERMELYDTHVFGQWSWALKATGQAIIIDGSKTVVAAAPPEHAPGIVAALNTFEGRAAYGKAMLWTK